MNTYQPMRPEDMPGAALAIRLERRLEKDREWRLRQVATQRMHRDVARRLDAIDAEILRRLRDYSPPPVTVEEAAA